MKGVFIEKNTPELRKRLEQLGIKPHGKAELGNLFVSNGRFQSYPQGFPSKKDCIYCGTDVDKFFDEVKNNNRISESR